MSIVYVAWRSPVAPDHKWGPVGRLDRQLGHYRFMYTKGAEKLDGFQPFPGMDDISAIYESGDLLPLFQNRMLSKSRPEYREFLKWSGFDPATPPEPLALLGVTEGRRETDFVEIFPCPEKNADGYFSLKFFLHGIRHIPNDARREVKKLTSGESLGLMLDISNPNDLDAVAIRTCSQGNRKRYLIGYLPRYLARDIRTLTRDVRATDIMLSVEQVNANAPLQQMVLCRLESPWPSTFEPCCGDDFTPIPSVPESYPETAFLAQM